MACRDTAAPGAAPTAGASGPRKVLWRALAAAALCALAACSLDSQNSLLSEGKALAQKKDHRGAAVQFKAALQKNPQSAEARYLLGKALLDSGDPVSAVVELSKAMDQKFAPDLVLPALARALLLSGEARRLTQTYQDVQLRDPVAQASLKSSLATAWGALGDRLRTEEAAAAALAAKADFPPAIILQARLMAGRGDHDQALGVIEQLLSRDESLYEAWHLKGEILLHTRDDQPGAEAAFQRALQAERAYVPAHLALVAMRLRARDFPAAKQQLAQLRAVLPQHAQTIFVESQIAFHERDYGRARELVQQLLKAAPNHVGTVLLAGAIEGQAGSLLQAQTFFARAVQLNPDSVLARRSLAQAYLRLGQASKALEALHPLVHREGSVPEAFALAGEAHLQLGNPQAAEAAFLRAAKMAPDNIRVRTALALTALARGDDSAAFAELEALSARDREAFVDMAIVSVRLKRREFDQALKVAQAMTQKQPNSATVLNLLGRVHLARRDLAGARQAFEQALRFDPSMFAATSSLAALDVAEKKPEQARQRLEQAIKSDGRNHLARVALADLRATEGAPEAELQALLTAAVKASPGEAVPRLRLVDRALQQRRWKDALQLAQDAVAVLPGDQDVLDALGRAQAESGDKQQALSTFRRMATLDPRAGLPHVRLADVHKALGDRAAAEQSLRKALDLQPELGQAQATLMDLLLADNRFEPALETARRLQERRPAEPAGYLFEAGVHLRARAPDKAILAYRKGLAKAPSDSELGVALHKALSAQSRDAEADQLAAAWLKQNPEDLAFHYQVAVAAIRRNQLDLAESRLRHVVAQRPGHALALNNLAWLLTVRGKPGAVALAREAVAILPDRPPLMDTLAMALAAEGQALEALTLQRKAVELAPNDLGLRLNLAKIALKADDKELARRELKALEAVGATLPMREEVLQLMKGL